MVTNTFEPYLFYKEYPFINSILTQLKEQSSVAFIAGGCPRDIYLDKPFTDIDIYTSSDCDLDKTLDMLRLIPTVTDIRFQTRDELPVEYRNKYIFAVISFEAKKFPFQIIITTRNTIDDILNTFAIYFSQFYFLDRNIYYTKKAYEDFVNKTITLNKDVFINQRYIDKIKNKFPKSKVIKLEDTFSF